MKPGLLLFLLSAMLLSAFPSLLSSQTPCGAAFPRIIAEGDTLFKKGQYKAAFEKYRAARGCTEARHEVLDEKTEDVLRAVDGEREKADRNAAFARKQQQKAEAAQRKATRAQRQAEEEEDKATAVLNKIYFYQDRFGLAYDGSGTGSLTKTCKPNCLFSMWKPCPLIIPALPG